jgi:hypothetical protein
MANLKEKKPIKNPLDEIPKLDDILLSVSDQSYFPVYKLRNQARWATKIPNAIPVMASIGV